MKLKDNGKDMKIEPSDKIELCPNMKLLKKNIWSSEINRIANKYNEITLIRIFKNIKKTDWVFSSWRNHYHAILKGVPLKLIKKEIISGRSMGLNFKKYNFYSSSIVGGIIPIALGVAKSIKLKKSKIILMTTEKMFWPIFYTVLTTICAFLSLIFSEIKPIIDFGWMMTVGLLVSMLVTFTLLPTVLNILGKKNMNFKDQKKSKITSFLVEAAKNNTKITLLFKSHLEGILDFISGSVPFITLI